MCMSNAKLRNSAKRYAEESDYDEYLAEKWEEFKKSQIDAFKERHNFDDPDKVAEKIDTLMEKYLNDEECGIINEASSEGLYDYYINNYAQDWVLDRFVEEVDEFSDTIIRDEDEWRDSVMTDYISGYEDYCYEQYRDEQLGL